MADTEENARSSTRSPSKFAAPATDWLPSEQTKVLTKSLTKNFIRLHKYRDWFLTLAWAMYERSEPSQDSQGRMLAKLYCFLRDHQDLRRGLTGKYAHIRGEDVMHHLLSHIGEFSPSRHKLTKEADAAFTELESWMQRGSNWKEALNNAKTNADRLEKEKGYKQKIFTRAPILYSAAGMLAILIIAHPDPKYMERIGHLQIQWMMDTPRDALDVQEGYWKGLSIGNLEEVFVREEVRKSEVPLLADYDRLFGKDFIQRRRDIRPCLQSWAEHITLEDAPPEDGMDVEILGVNSIEVENIEFNPTPVVKSPEASAEAILQRHLHPDNSKAPRELEEWLISMLSGPSKMIRGWTDYWVYRMDKVNHYEEQLIVQSLFLQSLRRLYNLFNANDVSEAVPDAYILLDMDDEELIPQNHISNPTQLRELSNYAGYVAYANANAQFCGYAEGYSQASKLSRIISSEQATHFYNISVDETFSKYTNHIISFEMLRTHLLIQAFEKFKRDKTAHDGEDNVSLLDQNYTLLEDTAIDTLKLTKWQLRQVFVPEADLGEILTDWQLRIWHQKFVAPDDSEPDLSLEKPIIFQDTQDTGAINSTKSDSEKLLILFGDLTRPDAESLKTSTSLASSIALQAKPLAAVASLAEQTTLNEGQQNSISNTGPTESGIHSFSIPSSPSKKRPFAGMKYVPIKRNCTSDRRNVKVSKLADMTKDELKQELRSSREELKVELHGQFASEIGKSQEGISLVASSLERTHASTLSRLQELVRNETKNTQNTIKDTAQIVQREMRVAEDQLGAVMDEVKAVRTELRTLESTVHNKVIMAVQSEVKGVQASIQDALTTLKDQIVEEFDVLRKLATEEPVIGEDGFLIRHCPVPTGLDARAYEAKLLSAACFYINLLGNPDDGVGADMETIDETLARFPDLPEEHVVSALEHVHLRRYNCPLKRHCE